jgi:DNA-binding NarL/FixJ family response regulator
MRTREHFGTVLLGKAGLLKDVLTKMLCSANFPILASVSCADDLLVDDVQSQRPLFLIVHTGDDFNAAIEQIELLSDRDPDARIAIVTHDYRLEELVSAFRAGANGYFVSSARNVFIESINLAMMGQTMFPPECVLAALDRESGRVQVSADKNQSLEAVMEPDEAIKPLLSRREKSILHCLVQGDSNKCIARKNDIAEATVKVHVKAILRKLGVHNRTQAAIWAMNNRD